MARRKPRRPSPDRESRRTEIIAAAVRLCARLGMENLTFGAIAKETSLSRPLIYFYFPDLASLLLEALRVGSNDLHQRFLSAVHADATGLDQIRSLGRAYVNFAREQPEMFELLAHTESKQPQGLHEHPAMQQCMQNQESILGLLVAALQKGGRDRSIRRDIGDPLKVALCLWGQTHGLIQLAATKQENLQEQFGPAYSDLTEFGLDLITVSLAAPGKQRRA